jgi:hypothetical protein
MPVFPKSEAEILELAQSVISGLTAASADFPAPPVSVADLQAALDATMSANAATTATRAAAEIATVAKNAEFDSLAAALRADLRYAEDAVAYNDAKLNGLGWAGKARRSALAAPGQPQTLEVLEQGKGLIALDWKGPTEGGRTSSYRIECREHPEGVWAFVDLSFETQATLLDQERGKELEYRVVAMNKAGEGMPSNTVMAVL